MPFLYTRAPEEHDDKKSIIACWARLSIVESATKNVPFRWHASSIGFLRLTLANIRQFRDVIFALFLYSYFASYWPKYRQIELLEADTLAIALNSYLRWRCHTGAPRSAQFYRLAARISRR